MLKKTKTKKQKKHKRSTKLRGRASITKRKLDLNRLLNQRREQRGQQDGCWGREAYSSFSAVGSQML